MTRTDRRMADALRPYEIHRHFQKYPAGSVLIEMGNTKVICAASIEDRVPFFLRGTGEGWIAAEYSLLPSATGEITVTLDCDVIQADGGTRTASITGAFVALVEACASFYEKGKIFPVKDFLSAISVGVSHEGEPILDLCYEEDSRAIVDMNVVMTGAGRFVEVQGTGERSTLSRAQLDGLLDMGQAAIERLVAIQNDVTGFRD